jgi:predicted ester cyclase
VLPIHMALVGESNAVSGEELTRVAAALDKQVTRDFGPIWSVEATVNPVFNLDDVPIGYWPIILVAPGSHSGPAMGYHQDRLGQPYAKVPVTPSWSLAASHECLETLVDPFGDRMVPGPYLKDDRVRVSYLVEVCDPVQSPEFSYTVNGVLVSDFVTPFFYGPVDADSVRYSFTGAATSPWEVKEGGYISWRNQATERIEQLHCTAGTKLFISLGSFEGFMGSVREFVDLATEHLELEQGLSHDDERLQAAINTEEETRQIRQDTAQALRDQMFSKQDKTLAERFWDTFNRAVSASNEDELNNAIEGLAPILDNNVRLHHPIGEIDRAGVESFFRISQAEVREEAPEFQVKYEDPFEEPLSAEGTRIVCRWRGSERHNGELQKIGSSGEEIQETEEFGISIFRTSQGQIADIWIVPSRVAWIDEARQATGGLGRVFRRLLG